MSKSSRVFSEHEARQKLVDDAIINLQHNGDEIVNFCNAPLGTGINIDQTIQIQLGDMFELLLKILKNELSHAASESSTTEQELRVLIREYTKNIYFGLKSIIEEEIRSAKEGDKQKRLAKTVRIAEAVVYRCIENKMTLENVIPDLQKLIQQESEHKVDDVTVNVNDTAITAEMKEIEQLADSIQVKMKTINQTKDMLLEVENKKTEEKNIAVCLKEDAYSALKAILSESDETAAFKKERLERTRGQYKQLFQMISDTLELRNFRKMHGERRTSFAQPEEYGFFEKFESSYFDKVGSKNPYQLAQSEYLKKKPVQPASQSPARSRSVSTFSLRSIFHSSADGSRGFFPSKTKGLGL